MTKAISEIFDVEHTPNRLVDNLMKNYEPSTDVVQFPEVETESDSDIRLAQDNLKDLIKMTKDSLYDALEIARSSEAPRAFEVVTGMINASADLSTRLIDSHSTKQKMKRDAGGKTQDAAGNITNNNLFVGTPNELAKLLKGQNGTI
jgi:hypothetical protein